MIQLSSPNWQPPAGVPQPGDIVSNFSTLARVVAIHENGDYLLESHGLDKFPGNWLAPLANITLVEVRNA